MTYYIEYSASYTSMYMYMYIIMHAVYDYWESQRGGIPLTTNTHVIQIQSDQFHIIEVRKSEHITT